MIQELSFEECDLVDGGMSAVMALTYIGIGAVAIGTLGVGGAIVGTMLIAATLATAEK
ncbi:hypothetical protein U1839_21070 [Sphingomonas sp. RT2P30]|uniref:hypothetical protein n=1 Tax=Parasphingomonas halimpatiens TaxID=3096162 RepID=UPI002FC714B3